MAADALHLQTVMTFMRMKVQVRLRMDSSAGKAIAQRLGVGRVRCLDVRTLWLQAKVRDKKLVIVKQDGENNIADIGTKVLTAGRFQKLVAMLGRRRIDMDSYRMEKQSHRPAMSG